MAKLGDDDLRGYLTYGFGAGDAQGLAIDLINEVLLLRRRPVLEDYSDALDEIYRLRRALAYEATIIGAHLTYKSFPKTRRAIAEDEIKRMRLAARGHSERAYAGISHLSLKHSFEEAGADDTLTRGQWEENRGAARVQPVDLCITGVPGE